MSTIDAGASPLKKGSKKHRRGRKLKTTQEPNASGNYLPQGQPPVRDVWHVPQNIERESMSKPPTKRHKHNKSKQEDGKS